MDRHRDRDYDGVPDWQEDENYADEAPIRGPKAPGPACAAADAPFPSPTS